MPVPGSSLLELSFSDKVRIQLGTCVGAHAQRQGAWHRLAFPRVAFCRVTTPGSRLFSWEEEIRESLCGGWGDSSWCTKRRNIQHHNPVPTLAGAKHTTLEEEVQSDPGFAHGMPFALLISQQEAFSPSLSLGPG